MTLNALLRQSAWPPSTVVACPGRLNDFLENGQVLGLNWCQTLKSRAFMSFQTLHLPAHNPTFHSMALTGSFGWSSEAGSRRGSLLMPSCWFGTLKCQTSKASKAISPRVAIVSMEPGTSSFTPKTPVQIAGRSYA